ncbi:barstar family protein [Megasphaera cerevisiae]|uniref:barstar family protein n=1 Tax=Megasphaera cerevisiae TaxID=39029 RepID=UPI0009445791|nr:barstar family protein [Megasphaera cerevisiae]OKY52982.1 hypothetical protein BSR42_09870 [Megasphaera cerevisiae]
MINTNINQVLYMNDDELNAEKMRWHKNKNLFIVEMDGKEIQTEYQFVEITQNLFEFPSNCHDNWPGYTDWMTDLEWLHKEGYILIIRNFSLFLQKNKEIKSYIMFMLIGQIMLFWQWEVEKCVVDGRRKPFILVLVN